ncbi:MAG: dihydrodipicolinate synthase family protein [Pirellulaceae bacterium]
MDTSPITPARLASSVIAVPPLARNSSLRICDKENAKIIRFIESGGVTSFLYGGNAVLYHARLSEYAQVLQTLQDNAASSSLMIPSVGPAYGTMMDQADVLAEFDFPTVMILPQRDISDAAGIASGIRRFAEKYAKPVVLYLKHDRWLPPKTVRKMYDSGLISWIKYAVVRDDPSEDTYLREVLAEVPSDIVVSGIGEQPAIVHMRDFEIGSFTSGCVCVNPRMSMDVLHAIQESRFGDAEALRAKFEGLEDLRNSINPIRVLHRAMELAGIANTGPMLPMLGELSAEETSAIGVAANELLELSKT